MVWMSCVPIDSRIWTLSSASDTVLKGSRTFRWQSLTGGLGALEVLQPRPASCLKMQCDQPASCPCGGLCVFSVKGTVFLWTVSWDKPFLYQVASCQEFGHRKRKVTNYVVNETLSVLGSKVRADATYFILPGSLEDWAYISLMIKDAKLFFLGVFAIPMSS